MDLDGVLLGFDKISSSWTKDEKQRKDRKALSHINSSPIKSNSTRRSEGKNHCHVMVELEQLCMTKSLPSMLHLK